MGGAQTNTEKTAGFTLPLLQRLLTSDQLEKTHRPIRALVLTPTRELASQVYESIETYGKYLPIVSTVVFGGVNINPQKKKLKQGVDVLVATPGRLLDHASQQTVDLSKVEILVLDEADRMLDMGYLFCRNQKTCQQSASQSCSGSGCSTECGHRPGCTDRAPSR